MSNYVPKKTYGGGASKYVLCQVVNRDDPEQSGRLQVRVFGHQEDKGLIPDQDLIWARPMFGVNNPMDGGVGGPCTGATTNTWFYASYGDGEQQLQLMHTIGKAGKDDGSGGLDQSGTNSDINPHTRDPSHNGGDFRLMKQGDDQKQWDQQSVTKYAKDEAPNPFGRQHSKDGSEDPNQSWSLAAFEY